MATVDSREQEIEKETQQRVDMLVESYRRSQYFDAIKNEHEVGSCSAARLIKWLNFCFGAETHPFFIEPRKCSPWPDRVGFFSSCCEITLLTDFIHMRTLCDCSPPGERTLASHISDSVDHRSTKPSCGLKMACCMKADGICPGWLSLRCSQRETSSALFETPMSSDLISVCFPLSLIREHYYTW
jgi:hypothetical protein